MPCVRNGSGLKVLQIREMRVNGRDIDTSIHRGIELLSLCIKSTIAVWLKIRTDPRGDFVGHFLVSDGSTLARAAVRPLALHTKVSVFFPTRDAKRHTLLRCPRPSRRSNCRVRVARLLSGDPAKVGGEAGQDAIPESSQNHVVVWSWGRIPRTRWDWWVRLRSVRADARKGALKTKRTIIVPCPLTRPETVRARVQESPVVQVSATVFAGCAQSGNSICCRS